MYLRNSWITQPGAGSLVPGAQAWLNGSNLFAYPRKINTFRSGSPAVIKTGQGESLNYAGSQYIACDTNVLPAQPQEATLVALVRLNSKAASAHLIGINDTAANSTLFRILYSVVTDRFSLQVRDNGENVISNCDGSTSPVVGDWYVVVGTYRPTRQRLYVNGRLEGSDTSVFSSFSFNFARVDCGALDRGTPINYLNGALPFAAIFPREFTQSEIASLRTPKDVWKLFAPQPRRVWNGAGGGTNTYTLSVSGGVTFSGAVPLLRTRTQVPSGRINFSGTAPLRRERQLVPSGGVTFGGTAPIIFNAPNIYTITPSGGVTFSGVISFRRERILVPTGGVSFSGAAPLVRTHIIVPTGQVTFSGSAPITFIPAGGSAYTEQPRVTVGSARFVRTS